MSLYPYICKYYKFPLGHPVIHVGDACQDIEAMLRKEGFVKCTILPPRRLYHPVLPFRCNNKLLFCLCRPCAIERNTDTEFTHESATDRALVGIWVIDEVRLAVEKVYKVLQVLEAYEYHVTQFDPATGDGGLFARYIDTFVKMNE
jgi:hypothetical protein